MSDMTPAEALSQYASVAWPDSAALVEIRCLPTSRTGGPRPVSLWCTAGELGDMAARLGELNAQGLNVYAGCLPRRANGGKTDSDCLPGWVVWSDFDRVDPRDAWKRATAGGLPAPSLAVNSGHGAHLFWGMTQAVGPAALSELVRDVAKLLDSDASVANPSRILRLPGFKNHKAPPAPCLLLHADASTRYDYGELRARVPQQEAHVAPQATAVAHGGQAVGSSERLERARRYVATIPGSGPGGRRTAAYKVACALCRDYGLDGEALTILAAWDSGANSPSIAASYGPTELERIIRNARRYGKHAPGRLAEPSRATRAQAAPPVEIPQPSGDDLGALAAAFDAEAEGRVSNIALPWPRLHDLIGGGLRPATLTVLGGPTGKGKSFFALEAAVCAHQHGRAFRWLPLEDSKVEFERRLLAHLAGDWRILSTEPSDAWRRAAALETHRAELADLAECVAENPRLGKPDASGKVVVPALPWRAVLDWTERAAERAKLLVIDPLAQLDFDSRDLSAEHGRFVRGLVGLAAGTGAAVLLVAHSIKRPGKASGWPLSVEDLQGGAELGRLAHTVLLLEGHELRESEVWRAGSCRETVEHTRTLTIGKARHGRGGGERLAFSFDGPAFVELGTIAPKQSRRKSGGPERLPYSE